MGVAPNIPGFGLLKLSYTVTLAAKTRLGPRQVGSAMRPENTPIRMTAAALNRAPDSVGPDPGYLGWLAFQPSADGIGVSDAMLSW